MIYTIKAKPKVISLCFKRPISSHIFKSPLSNEIKKEIEAYWFDGCQRDHYFDSSDAKKPKFYALSMFPYPSGSLHLGHVRVYTLSDVIARFHRMNGKNVFQPIGWDAFGLPAENAAIERRIPPHEWTWKNIAHMKEQLKQLRCTFDWQTEIVTCSPDYYKWTQYLFLKMYDAGLVYQKESLVNWDPIDCTVLAQEQVNSNGCSWRSGAKVEKRILKQWFIRTTKFSQSLHDGLNTGTLLDWDDIIVVQKNWIGECDGYSFDFKIKLADRISDTNCLNIWVRDPLSVLQAAFIVVQPNSLLDSIGNHSTDQHGKLDIEVVNPFTNNCLPVYVSEEVPYAPERDVYVGVPSKSEFDNDFAKRVGLATTPSKTCYSREEICNLAQNWCIGGYPVSSKIQDWLISRQRYWGTPIPVIHCSNCGVQPVPYDQLPVTLPPLQGDVKVDKALNDFLKLSDWKKTICPKCNGEAFRDTDTMDTFVDSSWYYLRYTDVNNTKEPFDKDVANKFLPVDLYVGGKEHAVLHLYYARFFSHFLHSIGLVEHKEPFKRLLCQGMVKGPTYKTKSGKYLKPDEILTEGKVSKSKETGEVLQVVYEKMSKSKYNGIDPKDIIDEYGIDTTRLFLLFNASPKAHCEWNEDLFSGVLKWQYRMWLTIQEFITARENPTAHYHDFDKEKENSTLRQARNQSLSRATYNYLITQQLMSVIRAEQELTSALRGASYQTKAYCEEFERALGTLIIVLTPLVPHFAATLWCGFTSAPRIPSATSDEFCWDKNVFEQKWPRIDADCQVPLYCQINGKQKCIIQVTSGQLSTMTSEEVFKFAQRDPVIQRIYERIDISNLEFRNYDNLTADLNIIGKLKKSEVKKVENKQIPGS